jgi:phosphoribosylformylglycinamidine synthase subunit PurS
MIQVHIRIMPKSTILDPQGQTVLHALESLGFDQASACRVGKFVTLDFPDMPMDKLEDEVAQVCQRLLVNPNTETWEADYLTLDGDVK